jgi:phosphopentomutase
VLLAGGCSDFFSSIKWLEVSRSPSKQSVAYRLDPIQVYPNKNLCPSGAFCYSARMVNRVVLLVIDGLGTGALPDAAEYGDAEANTLMHLAEAVGGLSLPNLEALGLGHVTQIQGVRSMAQPNGCFGRLGFASQGKDSVVGYWETSGVIVREGGAKYAAGIPADVVAVIEHVLGRKLIGNRTASMTLMLHEYGAEHISSGAPILWTDGGNTTYLAVHESVMPPADFQQRCREAWKAVKGRGAPIRVVAQPVTGEVGAFQPDHDGDREGL